MDCLKVYMGEIVKTKNFSDKTIYKIELTEEEARQLKNHVKNIHLFSAGLCNHAKYFTIPLSLKSRKRKRYSKVSYQKIETEDKVFFLCTVNKDPLF